MCGKMACTVKPLISQYHFLAEIIIGTIFCKETIDTKNVLEHFSLRFETRKTTTQQEKQKRIRQDKISFH